MDPSPPASTITTTTTALSPTPSSVSLSSSIGGSGVASFSRTQHDYLQLAALCVVGLASSMANLLVLVTILMTRKLRSTPSSVLVNSLALADVAVTSLTVPLAACGLINQRWIFSKMTCTLTSTLIGVFSAASALSVAAIAVDRYLAILYCLRFSAWSRWRYVLTLLAFIWLPALFFGVLLSTDAATTRYIPEMHVCDVAAAQSRAFVWTRAVVVFLCPLAVLIFAYARVIIVARVHSRKIDVVSPRNHNRKGSSENARRAESVSPNGAVAAGAMFSVRRLSILSMPQQMEGASRRQFLISSNVEVVSNPASNPRTANEDASSGGPQKRSCASLKLTLLVVVFALCCGFHTAVSLYETVVHHRPHPHSAISGRGGPLMMADEASGTRVPSSGFGHRSNVSRWLREQHLQQQQHSVGPADVDATVAVVSSDHQTLLTAGFWLLLINSLLNPFLYAISSQRFRYFAFRLFTRHDSHDHHHHHHHHHRGRDPCGGGGGHLFDVSIYSAFLRNLQAPSSRRSSACDSCYGELSQQQQQQFPLTALANHGSVGGDSASRRDSGCSMGTVSTTVVDNLSCSSASSSPVPRQKQIGGRGGAGGGAGGGGGGSGDGGRGPSPQFLEVPFGAGSEDQSPTLSRIASFMPRDASGDLDDDDDDDDLEEGDAPEPKEGGGAGDIVVTDRRKSVTSVGCGSVCSVCEYRSVPVRTSTAASGTGLGSSHVSIEDDFTFSVNNAARIRIVLDLV